MNESRIAMNVPAIMIETTCHGTPDDAGDRAASVGDGRRGSESSAGDSVISFIK
ncbi:hypothetical protein GCM10018953_35140 [Streptosporangium nondiastaticum]